MLGITGANVSLHIIEFPSGRFGYVGSIPTDLGKKVPADRAAILGCRSFRDPETDESMMWLKRKDFIQFPPHGFVSLRVFGSHHNMRLDGINSPKFITDLVYNGFNVTQVEEDGMKLWRWALHNVSFEAGFTYLKLNAADSTINVD